MQTSIVSPSVPRPPSRTWLVVPALLASAALALFYLDVPVARLLRQPPSLFRQCLEVCEPFGNGVGVAFLVAIVWRADVRRRAGDALLLLVASLGSGLVADGIKMLVGRQRPRAFNLDGSALASFQSWLPALTTDNTHSLPSAHTATAVGLACGLAMLYPAARYVFLILAIAVGLQRIASGAHFASDVLSGAAIGATLGLVCLRWRRSTEAVIAASATQPSEA